MITALRTATQIHMVSSPGKVRELLEEFFYKTLRRNSNMILTDVVAGEHSKYL